LLLRIENIFLTDNLLSMQELHPTGKVIIAGAGPGDPELLTLKALRALQQAEVVLTDRLVSEVILTEYVSPAAEIIHVGKQCRKGASTPQQTINELMVHYATLGKKVVRLKGGDVSVFSNILDELIALQAAAITYEIIPGITAALGAAAYSGIPLTAREHATAVRFLTCYQTHTIAEKTWKELAGTDDTLVIYMSAETLPEIVNKLVANSISEEKLLAVVEQATTPFQRVHTANLYKFHEELGGRTFVSPSLLIIGKVVALHHQFQWKPDAAASQEYFAPVAARLVSYENNQERA
jgi:uroporphyrin-III C-methyltransferase